MSEISIVDEVSRTKVLELLGDRRVDTHKEIGELLGWRSPGGALMPYSFIAAQIGISSSKIYSIINRDRHQQEAILRKKALVNARQTELISHISSNLHFSIMLPKNWNTTKDELVNPIDPSDLEKIFERIDRELPNGISTPTSIPIIYFRKEELINQINLFSMVKGAFTASYIFENEAANIEVLLLSLPTPNSPMDIGLPPIFRTLG
jgi:hypothetical protein